MRACVGEYSCTASGRARGDHTCSHGLSFEDASAGAFELDESPELRSEASRNTRLECSQLTLDDWVEALRATPTDEPARGSATSEVAAAAVVLDEDEPSSRAEAGDSTAPQRRSATELLETPGALLTRSHLRELGLERRAIDAVFRKLAVVFLPGYSRPMVRVEDYLELVREFTYRGDRVRPIAKAS